MKESFPLIFHNIIKENKGVGLLIQNYSKPSLDKNVLKNNEIDVVCESEDIQIQEVKNKKSLGKYNIFLKKNVCQIF